MSREDLATLHTKVKAYCQEHGQGPGTEGFSLMACLGACLGNWPRVKRTTFTKCKKRLIRLLGQSESAANG